MKQDTFRLSTFRMQKKKEWRSLGTLPNMAAADMSHQLRTNSQINDS